MTLNIALINLTAAVRRDTDKRTPQSMREIIMAADDVKVAANAILNQRLDVLADQPTPSCPLAPLIQEINKMHFGIRPLS
jgi:hypothetical protein